MADEPIEERTWKPFPHLGFIHQTAHTGEAVLYKHGRGQSQAKNYSGVLEQVPFLQLTGPLPFSGVFSLP